MAWYERDHEGHREVRVIEVRGSNIWERVVRTSTPDRIGPGRVRIVQECSSEQAAHSTAEKLGAQLIADKWTLLDAEAGVDRPYPKSRPPKIDSHPGANDLEGELRLAIKGLAENPTVEAVVRAFGAVMKKPMAVRRHGYWFEVHFPDRGGPGSVSIRTQVSSQEACWREIGLTGTLEVQDERETINEVVDTPSTELDDFLSDVRASESFRCIADCICSGVEAKDFDVD